MKAKRASEIAASPVMANVTYFGVPVYIESVSLENRSAAWYTPSTSPTTAKQSASRA